MPWVPHPGSFSPHHRWCTVVAPSCVNTCHSLPEGFFWPWKHAYSMFRAGQRCWSSPWPLLYGNWWVNIPISSPLGWDNSKPCSSSSPMSLWRLSHICTQGQSLPISAHCLGLLPCPLSYPSLSRTSWDCFQINYLCWNPTPENGFWGTPTQSRSHHSCQATVLCSHHYFVGSRNLFLPLPLRAKHNHGHPSLLLPEWVTAFVHTAAK